MTRLLLSILLILFSSFCYSQQKFIKYFDSTWAPSIQANARFYTEFEKIDSLYKCISYYYPSNNLYGKSTFADTLFQIGIGKMIRYYDNGLMKDSGFFFQDPQENFSVTFTYHKNGSIKDSVFEKGKGGSVSSAHYQYTENGKLKGFSSYDSKTETWESVGYDDNGIPIPNYIFQKKAVFHSGVYGWANFLSKTLNSQIPTKNKAPAGQYIVTVSFSIDTDGKVIDVVALNDPGFGTAEEAVRVIRKSPIWSPAISENKTIKYNHIQRITFIVSEEK